MGLTTLSHYHTDRESDPSAALLELDWTDPTGNDHSVQWLIAESWWAESFAPPNFVEIIKVAPLAIPLAFLSHGWAIAQTYRRRGKLHDLLAEIYYSARLWFWFIASIFAAPLVYILLWVTQVLSWIPLDTFQSSARAVRALLMGVVGDAVALVTDRAIRATLVERVERDLDWLATRCKSVLIVGHSQGAMLAYLAARTRPNNVKRLLTLGSGFRALQTLIDGIETRFPSIPDCFAIAQVAAAGVLAAAASALDAGWGCPGARRVMFHARDLYWNLWHRFPFSYSGGTQRCGGILACTDGGREFCLVRCDSQSRPRSRPR